ncbi:MAG: IS1182 family transposase [Deltaproteobacteria bacterium]|nr:IS1182 family transposase [Deltaproteobacteria bacterium]
MTRWAGSPLAREQIALFSPTLDSSIEEDHPVRLQDEILSALDWSCWENKYFTNAGQPAIHPRIVASVLLYGMSHGIRSSRRLEWACRNAIDFIWLAEGRRIDHSTFCKFRTRFRKELKDIFRQLGHVAMTMGMVRLNQIALDGTKIRANSSRKGATAQTIACRIKALDEQIDKWFSEAEVLDKKDGVLFEDSGSPNVLPRELSKLQSRRVLLTQALEAAKRVDAIRQKRSDRTKAPASVPVADPDSQIMPNKDGGFAPNYTPVVAADGECGYIADTEVIPGNDEAGLTATLIDQIEDDYGQKPQEVLADALFSTGPTLQALEDREVDAYISIETGVSTDNNPAIRGDLTKPVPSEQWPQLPRSPQSKRLDRSAFIYSSIEDCYYCPTGKKMAYSYSVQKVDIITRYYECGHCYKCDLATECVTKDARSRRVTRDQYQHLREKAAARMRSTQGKKNYGRRMWLSEGVFGSIKAWIGLRQFLCRGLDKVRTEWLWACTAFNLAKLVRAILNIRRKTAALTP